MSVLREAINGSRLRQLRRVSELTQAQLGERVGVSRQLIAAWEREARTPSRDQLGRLTGVFENMGSPTPPEAAPENARGGVVVSVADGDRLLTVREAAALLQISPATCHRRAVLGDLPAIRLWSGRRAPLRFSRGELLAWLERRRVRPLRSVRGGGGRM